jgi:hypothetical protein
VHLRRHSGDGCGTRLVFGELLPAAGYYGVISQSCAWASPAAMTTSHMRGWSSMGKHWTTYLVLRLSDRSRLYLGSE